MINEKSLLYDLCERTYKSRILENAIEAINTHLRKLANQTRSTAVIMVTDISKSDQINGILVGFHMIFPNTICVNIGRVNHISFNSIYDFIYQYYEDQNINVNINHDNKNIELSWESNIQEYLDANTKASDNTSQTLVLWENICIDIETFMSDCEVDKIFLYFISSEEMNDGYDVDADSTTKTFKIMYSKTYMHHNIEQKIWKYFIQNKKYHIHLDANATRTLSKTVVYILRKLLPSEDVLDNASEPYDDETITSANKSIASNKEIYYVRKSWEDKKSQIGVFDLLENAKTLCNAYVKFTVYDGNGTPVYGAEYDDIKKDTDTVTSVVVDPITNEGSYEYNP